MRNLQKRFSAMALTAILMMGTTFANAGIIVTDAADQPAPCTDTKIKVDSGIIIAGATGIIVAGFTGIIVAGFTGIIVAGATNDTVDCGIIVAG